MYHQVESSPSPSSLKVAPESFRKQVDWLERKAFRFLSVDEVVDRGGWISLWDRAVALTFDDGFRDNQEHAFDLLVKKKRPAALFVVVDWVGQNGFLNWPEIRELSNQGITIGSHSLSHRWLPDISDYEELEKEISGSKKRIEDEIGREIRYFSYPVGGMDQRVADCVKKSGYRAAWVAGARPTVSIKDPLLSIRRIKVTVSDSNLSRFAIKAYGIKGLFR